MKKYILVGIVLVIAAFLFLNYTGGTKTGLLVMKITDARPPANIDAINLTISKIEIHKADADEAIDNETNVTEENVSETSGWIIFSDETQTFDLLQLQGITDILGNKTLEVGKYTQIRLTVESVMVIEGGNVIHDAIVPSNKVKIIKPFEIKENQTTTIVLDFEADKFVVVTGAGKYLVKPTQIKISLE